MREGQLRGHEIWVIEQYELQATTMGITFDASKIAIKEGDADWFKIESTENLNPSSVDVVIMRKDPPFNMEYIYATYILEAIENEGVLVVNSPRSIRDFNEKYSILKYPDYVAPTIVSSNLKAINKFIKENGEVVLKPLDGMGGASIFRSRPNDPNLGVIIEILTKQGRDTIMVQRYIPEITDGDKRVLLIDGEPAPFSLARIPQGNDHRGNLAAGGQGVAMPLNMRETEIAKALGPELASRGLLLVGLDIIGGYLTEINVTSPTCMREIQDQTGFDVPSMFIDALEIKVKDFKSK